MSAFVSTPRVTRFRTARPGLPARIAARFSRFVTEFRRALRVVATRQDVSRLDDRMLQDLGISRAQAAFEASRGPWHTR